MSDERYNGWRNYPTWVVNLWLTNDVGRPSGGKVPLRLVARGPHGESEITMPTDENEL